MGWYPGKNIVEAFGERQKTRLEHKDYKMELKYNAQNTAYQNGIDPRASMWNNIGGMGTSLFQNAGNVLTSMYGNPQNAQANASATSSNNNMIMVIAAIFLAAIIFGKKLFN